MSGDELTPVERDALRARITDGARRIRPVPMPRGAWVAASVAIVFVVAIAAGLVALNLAPPPVAVTPAPSPAVTPTPTRVPTPTPTPDGRPVVALGGDCSTALSQDEATALTGQPMTTAVPAWGDGATTVLGGLVCRWVSSEVYLGATVTMDVYPVSAVPAELRAKDGESCGETGADARPAVCTVAVAEAGTWVRVEATGASGAFDSTTLRRVLDTVVSRVASGPVPVAATPSAQWWGHPGCATLAEAIDPSSLGATVVEYVPAEPLDVVHQADIPELGGISDSCTLRISYADRDAVGITVQTIRGGAVDFGSVLVAPNAQPVAVDGAQAAVWVAGNDPYEGSWDELVSTDGVNVLRIDSHGYFVDGAELAPVAAAMLRALG